MKLTRNIIRKISMLILLTVILHAIILINLKTRTDDKKTKKLVRDHEVTLCNFRLDANQTLNQPRQECPDRGIITVFYGGRLSIQICAYSSVLAVSRMTRLQPFVPICMHTFLSQVFADLSIPPLTRIADCDIPLPSAAQTYEDWSNQNESLVLPVLSCLSEFVLGSVNHLLGEFRFKEVLLESARSILGGFDGVEASSRRVSDPVFVGVHLIEFWDYEYYSDSDLFPSLDFYRRVFGYIRKLKDNNTVFVVVTDFEMKRNLFAGDDFLYVNTFSSPMGTDLALLSMCNMSVVGFEGVGLWGAIFSRGKTLVYDVSDDRFDPYLTALPHWQVYQ